MPKGKILLVTASLCVVLLSAQSYKVADAVMGGINLGNACVYNLNGGYLYGEKQTTLSTYGHHGIDWLAPVNSNVYAMYDGEIVTIATAGTDSYYKYIVIESDHPDYPGVKFYHLYAHLEENDYFEEGDPVYKGNLIAKSGDNDGHIGPHLHTEIRMSTNSYLQCKKSRGLLYGKVYDADNNFYQLIRIAGAPKADTYHYGASTTYYRMSNNSRFPDEAAYSS